MPTLTFAGIVSAFGAGTKAKLDNPAVSGAPEDQLRAPLETLFHGLAAPKPRQADLLDRIVAGPLVQLAAGRGGRAVALRVRDGNQAAGRGLSALRRPGRFSGNVEMS